VLEAWVIEHDPDAGAVNSDSFEIAWQPRSGKLIQLSVSFTLRTFGFLGRSVKKVFVLKLSAKETNRSLW
jgi:predicted NUDIX family NTP pyrophosphohydrolase